MAAREGMVWYGRILWRCTAAEESGEWKESWGMNRWDTPRKHHLPSNHSACHCLHAGL